MTDLEFINLEIAITNTKYKEHKGSVYINDVYKPLNYSSNSACHKCKYYDDDFNLCRQPNNVNKAPQSWQYVYVE